MELLIKQCSSVIQDGSSQIARAGLFDRAWIDLIFLVSVTEDVACDL